MWAFLQSIVSVIRSRLNLSPSRAQRRDHDKRLECPSERGFRREEVNRGRHGSNNVVRQNGEENARHDKAPCNVSGRSRVGPKTESCGTPQDHLDANSPENYTGEVEGPDQKAVQSKTCSKADDRTYSGETAEVEQGVQPKTRAAAGDKARHQDTENDHSTTEKEGHHNAEEVKPRSATETERKQTSHEEIHQVDHTPTDSELPDNLGVCAVEMIVARKWRIEARFSRFRGA